MIASEDVRRVTFDRTMRGYRCEDVDDYLKQVAESMDGLEAEKNEMQKKIVVLAQRIDQYRADEDTLRTTMLNAQRLGENVIKEAKQKAAEIIRAANIKAEDREQRSRDDVELARQELATLRREADAFKKSLMEMYRKHIELLTRMPNYLADEEPEPAPQPAQVQEPAPQPAPAPEEYEQQQFDMPAAPEPDGTSYVQDVSAPAEEPEDTLEFAFNADLGSDEQELQALDEPPAQERFAPGAGLYDVPGEPAARRKEGFSNVDFDS